MANNKYLCVHGHFYQPPRENAWLEVVEQQESAKPFHDWNERINFECYATNAKARLLNEQQEIIKIINNYSRISFNMGPTLLSWMEHADPDTYAGIQAADRRSQERFGGHGSALAQAYSHLIMPLANSRDKHTQVIWGIRDFESRFGRKPEGMWLAETAADTESLEVLAEHGIQFTILAPRQCKAIRRLGDEKWTHIPADSVDPRQPYLCRLPSGRSIALFFYDGGVSQAVAFEGLLNNGKAFASRLLGAFGQGQGPRLVHIATDGESYGHHHRYGEMALADCLNYIMEHNLATLTNYGQYLELFPPTMEAMIHENSSWSCVHGVERWRSNCGCSTGGRPGWNQEWRRPLRESLDWLRDQLIPLYEKEAGALIKSPWDARNDYIDVVLDRSDASVAAFLDKHSRRSLTEKERIRLLRLMEMQRQAILMFTSCGWFFDEISGLETNQILQYACRAIYYAKQVAGIFLQSEFIHRLSAAKSNLPQFENGAASYVQNVLPSRVDLVRVGMHYAASSLFEKYPQRLELFNYIATSKHFERIIAGNQRLALGQTSVHSRITHSEKHFSFAVLYVGQLNIIGNISTDMDDNTYAEMQGAMIKAFRNADLGEVIGLMQTYFGSEKYTVWHLFRDEKQKILNQITEEKLSVVENSFRKIYQDNYQLMSAILQSNVAVPDAYLGAAEYVLNADLVAYFQQDSLDIERLNELIYEFGKWDVKLVQRSKFSLSMSERILAEVNKIPEREGEAGHLQQLNNAIKGLKSIGIEPDVWKAQNRYYFIMRQYQKGLVPTPAHADWQAAFIELGKLLRVRAALPKAQAAR